MSGAISIEELRASELLAALTDDALGILTQHARRRPFGPGEVIFRKGDEGLELHIVTSGAVNIVQPDEEGAPVVAVIHEGEIFGELAVFDSQPRSATAIAHEDGASTIVVHRDDVTAVIQERPDAALTMLGTMARSLTYSKEELSILNHHLDDKVRDRTREVRETQLEVIRRLGHAAEYKDEDTGAHIFRMSNYAAALARAAAFEAEQVEMLVYAAPMHDVGKIGVPDRILTKPGKLDAEEWEVMKAHTIMGANMLAGSPSAIIKLARRIALTHHERWDGGGYPNGLRGGEIPLEARVCCIADVFDALTSVRPYKEAWSFDDALTEIDSLRGKAFDPELVDLFADLRPELEAIRDAARTVDNLATTTLTVEF